MAVHIYTKTIHGTTQITNVEECGPCPVLARFTLAFALQLTLPLTSALEGVGGQCYAPAALPTGKDPVPVV